MLSYCVTDDRARDGGARAEPRRRQVDLERSQRWGSRGSVLEIHILLPNLSPSGLIMSAWFGCGS